MLAHKSLVRPQGMLSHPMGANSLRNKERDSSVNFDRNYNPQITQHSDQNVEFYQNNLVNKGAMLSSQRNNNPGHGSTKSISKNMQLEMNSQQVNQTYGINNNLKAYVGQGHNHFVDHISSQISARSAKEDAIIDAESDSHDKEALMINKKYYPKVEQEQNSISSPSHHVNPQSRMSGFEGTTNTPTNEVFKKSEEPVADQSSRAFEELGEINMPDPTPEQNCPSTSISQRESEPKKNSTSQQFLLEERSYYLCNGIQKQ